MAYRALVTVAGVTLPDPSSYNATTGTVVDSARNAGAVVVGDVIRDDIAKVELSWNFITLQEWANILQLFDIASGGHFENSVIFLNQVTGTWTTRIMYISDRTASSFIRDNNGNIRGWTNCHLSLTEV